MANINFKLGFDLDKAGLQMANKELESLKKKIKEQPNFGIDKELQSALKSTIALENALRKAWNMETGKLNVKEFEKELARAGLTAQKMEKNLTDIGVKGAQTFNNINHEINKVGLSIKQNNKLLDDMFDTFGKTLKWGISSSVMNQMAGSIQRAIGFTKALDDSLNNVRVVSGKSADEMAIFAKEANTAAKELGKSTVEYTDASLIFFQQGKTQEEVIKLTEATLMGANVTGTEVSEMADLLTAVLNGYVMSANEALEVTDKLAAVGAATGADFEELATGMSKVASMAKIVGVDIDELNAQLATITSVTREAPESIGTSLKTIFGRMSEVKAGKADEEGWDLGKVEQTFNKVNMSVLDLNGNMKDGGDIITEVGSRWTEFDRETKMALSNALAGQRQANRLIALFENWDMYQNALNTSLTATGATAEQNAIRMDSYAYKAQQFRANLEELWMKIIDSDALKTGLDILNSLVTKVNSFVDVLGGIGGALSVIGTTAAFVFQKQITHSIIGAQDRFGSFVKDMKKDMEVWKKIQTSSPSSKANAENLKTDAYLLHQQDRMAQLADEEYKIKKYLSVEEHKRYKQLMLSVEQQNALLTKAKQQNDLAKERARDAGLSDEVNKASLAQQEKAANAAIAQTQKAKELTDSVRTSTNKTHISHQELVNTLGKENIILKEIEAKGKVSKNNNVQLKEVEKLINIELEHQRGLITSINELRDDGLDKTEEQLEAQESITRKANVQSEVEIEGLEKRAKRQERIQNLVSSAAGVGVAATGALNAFKAYKEAAGDVEKQTDAVAAGFTSLGTGLLMMPGIWTKVAGGAIMAATAIGKFVYENTGLRKVIKENNKLLESYKTATDEINESLSALTQARDLQNEILASGKNELVNLTEEEMQKVYQLGAIYEKISPELISHYDEQGRAIAKLNVNLDDAIQKEKDLLDVQNSRMLANRANFLAEYGKTVQDAGPELEKKESEIARLEKEISDMRAEGKSDKSIKKKESALTDLRMEADELSKTMAEVGTNIQNNVIKPFLSLEDISKGSIKNLSAAIGQMFDVEKVKKMLEVYGENASFMIDELTKDLQFLAQSFNTSLVKVEDEIIKMQNKAKLEGTANYDEQIAKLQSQASSIKSISTETISYIGDMTLQFNRTSSDAVTMLDSILANLKPIKNELGEVIGSFLDKPIEIERFTPTKEQIQARLAPITEEINKLDERISQLTPTVDDYKTPYSGQTEAAKKDAERLPLIEKRNQLMVEANRVQNDLGTSTSELNRLQEYSDWLWQKQILSISETTEGYNALVTSYNESYGILNSIDGVFEGLFSSIENYQSVLTQEPEMGEDLFLVPFRDAFEETTEKFGEFTEMTEEAREGIVENITAMSEESQMKLREMAGIDDSVWDKMISGSSDAADAVVKDISRMQDNFGQMWATLNKDSKEYYVEFRKDNKNLVGNLAVNMGLMMNEYSTYGEFRKALDNKMTMYTSVKNGEQTRNLFAELREQVIEQDLTNQGIITDKEEMYNAINNGAQLSIQGQTTLAQVAAAEEASFSAQMEAEMLAGMLTAVEGVNTTGQAIGGVVGSVAPLGVEAITAAKNEIEKQMAMALAKYQAAKNKAEELKAKIQSGGGDTTDLPDIPDVNFDYSGGGYTGGTYKPYPTGGTGPDIGGPSDSGGGGGDKGSSEKDVENMEWEKDIYHDINAELDRKSKLLDILQKQQDKLYGKALLDNLKQQKALLEQQKVLQEQKLKLQKEDAAEQAKALKAQGVIIDDATGMVKNYNDIIEAKVKAANALSGEAKEAAIEETEKFIEALNSYEELVNSTIWDTMNAISDIEDQIREIFLEELEFEIKLKVEISDDLQEALDFQKEMNDAFEDSSENYQYTMDQLNDKMKIIGDLQSKINDLQNRDDLTDKEKLDFMESYSEQLKEALKDAKDLEKELEKIFKDTLKQGLDMTKEHIDNFKDINKELDHLTKMLQLMGEGDNYEMLDDIYEAQYSNIMGQLDVLNGQMDVLKSQKAALEAAGMKGSEEWKAVDDAIKQTQQDINSLAQESLKLLQDEFKNTVDGILSSLEDTVTGGAGFDKLKEQQKDLKEERKKYLDQEEKLYEINKLQNKIQQEIDATTDPAARERLQKLMDSEVKKLKEKDKLTKYDIDRANQIYDLTLKQMALEDQRAAKNVMRLVRDTQGNWVYEFTEDAKAIEKAQQDVSDAMYKLNELDKKRLEETQDEMLKLQEEYYKEVDQITKDALAGKYKTEDEVRQALEAAANKYNEKMLTASKEYEQAKQNATVSSMGVILSTYDSTTKDLLKLTDDQDKALQFLKQSVGDNFSDLQTVMDAVLNGDDDSIKKAFGDLGFTVDDVMIDGIQSTVDKTTQDMKDKFGTATSDMISQMVGEGGFQKATEAAVDAVMDAWTEYQGKVQEVKDKTDLNLGDIKDRIDDAEESTDELKDTTQELIDKFKDEMTAVTDLTTSYEKKRKEIEENIKKVQEYIKALDDAIKKIKEKELAENPPKEDPKPPAPTPAPTPTPPPTTTPPKPSDPVMGSKVRVKSGRRWYYDSGGTNPSGPTDPYANRDLQITTMNKGARYEYNVGTAPGVYLGWLKKEDLVGFDTGGYTGQWGKSGKVAMLHEKEIVLNKDDTRNLLDAVNMTRGVGADLLSRIATTIMETSLKTLGLLDTFARGIMSNANVNNITNSNDNIQQNVTIHADFSGVKNSDEIEKAFENIGNMASQYVLRK